jgi:hypothetical protein
MDDNKNDLDNMHPAIAKRRRSTRNAIAYIEIYNNADVRTYISDEVETLEQQHWVREQIQHGLSELEKLLLDKNYKRTK